MKSLIHFDAFPKTLDEFKNTTVQGGIVSLLAFVLIFYLLLAEWDYTFQVETIDKMAVDGTRGQRTSINFDIDFPRMPCCLISIEVDDLNGNNHILDDNDSHIVKLRLDLNGQPIGPAEKHAIGGALKNESHVENTLSDGKLACGSCYGAEQHHDDCCNSCEDVKKAYMKKQWNLPSLHTIDQCSRLDFEKIVKGNVEEGCKVTGALNVSKLAGNILFAPGQIFRQGYLKTEDIIDFTFKNFDNSHKVNTLAFGEIYPNMYNPLDNRTKTLKSDDYGTYQYYLKVVATEFKYLSGQVVDTNQFSATEHFKAVYPRSGRGFPEVNFVYQFDPIVFHIEQRQRGYLQFITSLCAIVGGVFTIMGLVDSTVHSILSKHSRGRGISQLTE